MPVSFVSSDTNFPPLVTFLRNNSFLSMLFRINMSNIAYYGLVLFKCFYYMIPYLWFYRFYVNRIDASLHSLAHFGKFVLLLLCISVLREWNNVFNHKHRIKHRVYKIFQYAPLINNPISISYLGYCRVPSTNDKFITFHYSCILSLPVFHFISIFYTCQKFSYSAKFSWLFSVFVNIENTTPSF